MMILKKQPKSLLDEYHDLEAKIGQTKKILTHLNYLKHSSLPKNKHHLENDDKRTMQHIRS